MENAYVSFLGNIKSQLFTFAIHKHSYLCDKSGVRHSAPPCYPRSLGRVWSFLTGVTARVTKGMSSVFGNGESHSCGPSEMDLHMREKQRESDQVVTFSQATSQS